MQVKFYFEYFSLIYWFKFKHILLINSKGLDNRQSLCRPSPKIYWLIPLGLCQWACVKLWIWKVSLAFWLPWGMYLLIYILIDLRYVRVLFCLCVVLIYQYYFCYVYKNFSLTFWLPWDMSLVLITSTGWTTSVDAQPAIPPHTVYVRGLWWLYSPSGNTRHATFVAASKMTNYRKHNKQ